MGGGGVVKVDSRKVLFLVKVFPGWLFKIWRRGDGGKLSRGNFGVGRGTAIDVMQVSRGPGISFWCHSVNILRGRSVRSFDQ